MLIFFLSWGITKGQEGNKQAIPPGALKGQKHLAQGNTLGKDKFPLAP